MRQDIEFDAEGTTLRGWLYVPDGAHGPSPTIVMSHGFSATKELFLDAFERAREPKRLEILPGGHFDAYIADFERSSAVARDWFLEHLHAEVLVHH